MANAKAGYDHYTLDVFTDPDTGIDYAVAVTDVEAYEACWEWFRVNIHQMCADGIAKRIYDADSHFKTYRNAIEVLVENLGEKASPAIVAMLGESFDEYVDGCLETESKGYFLADRDETEKDIDAVSENLYDAIALEYDFNLSEMSDLRLYQLT